MTTALVMICGTITSYFTIRCSGADALPLPLCRDLKEVGVLREQHPLNRSRPREQLVVRHAPCGVFLRRADIDLLSTEAL